MPLIYNYIAENVRFKSGFDKKLGNGWKLQRPPIPPHGFFGKPLNWLSRAALLPRTLAPLLASTPAPQLESARLMRMVSEEPGPGKFSALKAARAKKWVESGNGCRAGEIKPTSWGS